MPTNSWNDIIENYNNNWRQYGLLKEYTSFQFLWIQETGCCYSIALKTTQKKKMSLALLIKTRLLIWAASIWFSPEMCSILHSKLRLFHSVYFLYSISDRNMSWNKYIIRKSPPPTPNCNSATLSLCCTNWRCNDAYAQCALMHFIPIRNHLWLTEPSFCNYARFNDDKCSSHHQWLSSWMFSS